MAGATTLTAHDRTNVLDVDDADFTVIDVVGVMVIADSHRGS
jgi:hypothetical protein